MLIDGSAQTQAPFGPVLSDCPGPSRSIRAKPVKFKCLIGHTVNLREVGEGTFNWSNVVGTAMSAGLSNAYYPPASRTAGAALSNWGTSVAGSGLANLLPEFLPDFKRWLKRHHL